MVTRSDHAHVNILLTLITVVQLYKKWICEFFKYKIHSKIFTCVL